MKNIEKILIDELKECLNIRLIYTESPFKIHGIIPRLSSDMLKKVIAICDNYNFVLTMKPSCDWLMLTFTSKVEEELASKMEKGGGDA